jgi:hypothetical protein
MVDDFRQAGLKAQTLCGPEARKVNSGLAASYDAEIVFRHGGVVH